jgi:hypothetical protein
MSHQRVYGNVKRIVWSGKEFCKKKKKEKKIRG